MGQSTDAILAFGFDLGEELPESLIDEEEGFNFEEWAKKKAGMEWTPDDKGYFDRVRDMLAKLPVTIETHCSAECPMYFIAAQDTVHTASRGYPAAASTHEVEQARIDAMKAFCDEHGIEWQEPQWHIFSYWG